jgi:hypothetical protein
MFLQHYGSIVTGTLLILVSLAASYMTWTAPRAYGSPRWPLLVFFLGILLKGIVCCRPNGGALLGLFSSGVLWFALGAVGTQWFHENIQLRRPVQR